MTAHACQEQVDTRGDHCGRERNAQCRIVGLGLKRLSPNEVKSGEVEPGSHRGRTSEQRKDSVLASRVHYRAR